MTRRKRNKAPGMADPKLGLWRRVVVKVQAPLATNEPRPMLLIYNEQRDVMMLLPMSPELAEKMRGDDGQLDPKAYFEARYYQRHDDKGLDCRIELGRRVAARGW